MKEQQYMPSALDFAYDVIALHEENKMLRHERDHYKKLHEMNSKALEDVRKSTMSNIGTIFKAVIDPDSAINKGRAALAREEMKGATNE